MKKILFILALLLPLSALAQPYTIDWHKISGGGGTSSGGIFSVSGTIGQHDAGGPNTNNSYVLYGGYWSLYAVQTPGAPALNIKLTNSVALVYWPYPSVGYTLQSNTNVTTSAWVPVSGTTVSNNGTINYVLVNPNAHQSYYRLVYP